MDALMNVRYLNSHKFEANAYSFIERYRYCKSDINVLINIRCMVIIIHIHMSSLYCIHVDVGLFSDDCECNTTTHRCNAPIGMFPYDISKYQYFQYFL